MKKVVFLAHESVRSWGSTVLRSKEMARLAQVFLSERGIHVSYTEDPEITNSLVVAHKGYLAKASLGDLSRLRAAGNIVVADWIDYRPSVPQTNSVDGLMASSHAQADWFEQVAPKIPVFHVTHLVDPRIPDVTPDMGRFRAAYFGAKTNALHPDELSASVQFIETPADDIRWMQELSNYSCHYAVRKRHSWDGFKPFTKGFVAAHCKCPIIISESEDDVKHYLKADYPYLLKDEDVGSVRDMLTQAGADFGGDRWRIALDIMAEVRSKSTKEFVKQEFVNLVSYYIA